MAGDWIKVEVATLDKPEVARMAELLGVKRDEMLGMLLRFWTWLDRHTGNGVVTHMSRLSIDDVMHVVGFGAVLESVGWGVFDDKAVTLTVPNFERHNGKPAKSRALGNKRKAEYDERKRNGNGVTKTSLEKRREENKEYKESAPPEGFAEFWQTWPPSERKGSKSKCLEVWQREHLAKQSREIIDHVSAMKKSRQWSDSKFIPAPLVYLNQRKWDGAQLPNEGDRLPI